MVDVRLPVLDVNRQAWGDMSMAIQIETGIDGMYAHSVCVNGGSWMRRNMELVDWKELGIPYYFAMDAFGMNYE